MTEPTGRPPGGDSPLNALDEQAARLRERWPGWRVWYVPRVGRGAWWSAQPSAYPLVAASPEELAEAIEADQAGGGES